METEPRNMLTNVIPNAKAMVTSTAETVVSDAAQPRTRAMLPATVRRYDVARRLTDPAKSELMTSPTVPKRVKAAAIGSSKP